MLSSVEVTKFGDINIIFFEGDIANVYLKFLGDDSCKRIAYAASFGTDNWEYPAKETAECKNWIQKFDAVSVREETGVKLCSTYYDIKAKHVLDPTMLLSKMTMLI